MYRIVIDVVPQSKERPRRGKGKVMYTPENTRQATKDVQTFMKYRWKGAPIEDPLVVGFGFYMPIPKSWSKKEKAVMLGRPHVSKPDMDNLIKLVKDAGNKILWKDDSQIWGYGKCFKIYSENPRIEIYLDIQQFSPAV